MNYNIKLVLTVMKSLFLTYHFKTVVDAVDYSFSILVVPSGFISKSSFLFLCVFWIIGGVVFSEERSGTHCAHNPGRASLEARNLRAF